MRLPYFYNNNNIINSFNELRLCFVHLESLSRRKGFSLPVGAAALDTSINLPSLVAANGDGYLAVSVITPNREVLDQNIILNEFPAAHTTRQGPLTRPAGEYKVGVALAAGWHVDSVKVQNSMAESITPTVKIDRSKRARVVFHVAP